MRKSFRSGMTLMEVVIAFALLVLLSSAGIYLISPVEQFAKAKDARRKNDLNELRKVFESWLGDKGCYPTTAEACYDASGGNTCNICTSHAGSPSLAAYTTSVLCDPDSPLRDYLYQPQGNLNCPTAYVIYSKLTSTYNAQNDTFRCTKYHGCGPPPFYGYDYVVTSPNAAISVVSNYFCYTTNNPRSCSSCGSYASCQDSVNRGVCSEIFGSKSSCCASHPTARFCP